MLLLVLLLCCSCCGYVLLVRMCTLPKLATSVTHNTAKLRVPCILVLPLLPRKRTADALMWFSPQRACAIWEIFRCIKTLPCSAQGRTRHCVTARNKCCYSYIQIPLLPLPAMYIPDRECNVIPWLLVLCVPRPYATYFKVFILLVTATNGASVYACVRAILNTS